MQTRRGFLKLVGKVAAIAGVASVAPSVVLAQKPKEVKPVTKVSRYIFHGGRSKNMTARRGSYSVDEAFVRQFERDLIAQFKQKGVRL